MKKFIIGGILTVVIMALPTIASAHTGTVTCDSRGVVFSYNANFAHNTNVTENVTGVMTGNGYNKGIVVMAHTATTNIIPFSSLTWPISAEDGRLVVNATWTDGNAKGSIPFTNLTCPIPAAPPVNPPVCPTNTVSEGMSNGVLVCVRTITNTVQLPAPPANTVTVTVTAPVVALKCPKGTKVYRRYSSGVICTKRHVVVKHSVKLIPYKPVGPPKKNHGVGGVAG